MSDSSRGKRHGRIYPYIKMRRIGGTKWEYPISKSTEYWEKFCDDMEKKLLKVRNTSCRSSFTSDFFTFPDRKSDNRNKLFDCSFSSKLNTRKSFGNSLHKVSRKVSITPSKGTNNKHTMIRVNRNFHRTPKLGTATLEPSFGKVVTHGPNQISNSFDIQRELRAKEENLNINSSSLPTLKRFPTLSEPTAKKNSPKKISTSLDSREMPKVKDLDEPTIAYNAEHKDTMEEVSSKATAISQHDLKSKHAFLPVEKSPQNLPKRSTKIRRLSYSIRCAYKALKLLTANKKFDFEPKSNDVSFEKSVSRSNDSSRDILGENLESVRVKDIEKLERDTEESVCFADVQNKLKRMWHERVPPSNTEAEDSTLTSEKSMSRTIPSQSRSTSGSSLEFAHTKTWKNPSSQILTLIPKLAGFPRKHQDRCLPCMYKSFEKPKNLKTSSLLATLQRSIVVPEKSRASFYETSQESDVNSWCFPDIEVEVEKSLCYEHTVKDVRSNRENIKTLTRALNEGVSVHSQPDSSNLTAQKIINLEAPCKLNDVEQKLEEETSENKNLLQKKTKESFKSKSTALLTSLELSKKISSPERQSSDEDDSLSVTIGDDPSKSKFLAPCHAPTVLRPSLNTFKALKNRKPTSLQSRIALSKTASLQKDFSIDEISDRTKCKSNDVQRIQKAEKTLVSKTLQDVSDKNILDKDKEDRNKRSLTKMKSMPSKLALDIIPTTVEKKQVILKKRLSSPSLITVKEGSTPSTSKDVESRDVTVESSVIDDNIVLKSLNRQDFPKSPIKLPLMCNDEILEILESMRESNASQADMLDTLCKEFTTRLSKDSSNNDANAKRCNEIAGRLTKLLGDSKRYLYPHKFPSDLVFSTNQPPLCNPRQLRRILPLDSYNLIAPLLGMSKWYRKTGIDAHVADVKRQRTSRRRSSDDITFDLLVHPPTPKEITSLGDQTEIRRRRLNPYALFLKKPRRKAVTWRPLTEYDLKGYDPDATLDMRARNMMNKICHDFCVWLDSLGGTDKTIDEEVLWDMFEIDFNAEACRAMQMSIQEMSMVPTEVARTRNSLGASKLAITRKHLIEDAKAERRAPKIKAFGTSIPWEFRFVPPNNQVQKKWLECENVPRDLETMETVWKDITHLESVRGFVKWLHEHPHVSPPEALKALASMDITALRRTKEDDTFAHLELDFDQIQSLKVADNDPD